MRSIPGRIRIALAVAVTAAAVPWLAAGAAQAAEQPPGAPTVTVSPADELDPAGDTVTVRGSGFEGVGVYVRTCLQPAGEIGTDGGRPASTDCDPDRQHWVAAGHPAGPTAPMGADGTFTVELDVVAAFGSVDCRLAPCGIAVRRDHVGGADDLSYDSFTPIAFAADGEGPTEPTVPTEPTEPTAPTEPTQPAAPAAGSGTVVGGELEWGVKAAFRRYVVEGPGQGSITMTPPATQDAGNGTFRFPLGETDGTFGPEAVDAAFAGAARFQAHAGVLDVTLADPQVAIDGDAGTLLADVDGDDDVPVADLDLSVVVPTAAGDVVTLAAIPATLTEEGAAAFSGSGGGYEAGEALDPVTLTLQVEGDLSGLPAPDPAADVVTCTPTGVVPAGSSIRACATGFLPGEQVRAFLHSTPVQIGIVTADATGAVAASVTIPATAAAGSHRLELRGVTSGRSVFSAPFTVVPARGSATLPRTGTGAAPLAATAAALLLAGAAALAARRRVDPGDA